ncbi:unnamed protein product [Lepidochelys kempii]
MEGKSTAENNGSWRQSALLSLAFEKQLLLQNTSQGLHKTWNSGFAPRQNKLESDPVVWTQAERIDDPAAVQEMQTYSSSAAQHSLWSLQKGCKPSCTHMECMNTPGMKPNALRELHLGQNAADHLFTRTLHTDSPFPTLAPH